VSSITELKDNGGRRLGIERRRFSYTHYIPERRFGNDRRSGRDRRSSICSRMSTKRNADLDRVSAISSKD
jgi:hypothetical protein